MSAREYASKKLHEFANPCRSPIVDSDDVIAAIIKAVKEEIPEWTFSAEIRQPELIQGYTAEQWQEIIDGGYLCEFSNNNIHWSKAKWKLEKILGKSPVTFQGDMEARNYCRPAQIKGVMRPIFVEPVDKGAWCVFLYDDSKGEDEVPYMKWNDFFSGSLNLSNTEAKSYIEV